MFITVSRSAEYSAFTTIAMQPRKQQNILRFFSSYIIFDCRHTIWLMNEQLPIEISNRSFLLP